jgi:hypothetical protein
MKCDVLMVLFSKHEPTDIKLLVTGKLQLNCMCKAYIVYILRGTKIIQVLTVTNLTTNISGGKERIIRCCKFDKHGSR